jgi:hypothetical protein
MKQCLAALVESVAQMVPDPENGTEVNHKEECQKYENP